MKKVRRTRLQPTPEQVVDPSTGEWVLAPRNIPPPTLAIGDIKVGDSFWFIYRDNPNCYGRVNSLHPATEKCEACATLFEGIMLQMFVTVPLTSLRQESTGRVKKRRHSRAKDMAIKRHGK